jgi:hypothetical protein
MQRARALLRWIRGALTPAPAPAPAPVAVPGPAAVPAREPPPAPAPGLYMTVPARDAPAPPDLILDIISGLIPLCPVDDGQCHICLEGASSPSAPSAGSSVESDSPSPSRSPSPSPSRSRSRSRSPSPSPPPARVRQRCGHSFHEACLLEWWLSSGATTCPLCRQDARAERKPDYRRAFLDRVGAWA